MKNPATIKNKNGVCKGKKIAWKNCEELEIFIACMHNL